MIRDDLQFDIDDVWLALEQVDAVSVLAEELASDTAGRPTPAPRLDFSGDLVRVHDPATETSCLLPIAPLRLVSTAVRAAFAARQLLGPAVVTAGVLASGPTAELMLGVIARHVPGISHVALFVGTSAFEPGPRLVDQLDLAGVSLTVAQSAEEAVRGANLVIACGATLPDLRIAHLSPRSVLVNAVGDDLPDELVDQVGGIYVDEIQLLETHRSRRFVESYLAGSAGTHRPRTTATTRQDIDVLGDFRDLLDTRHGPTHLAHIVLVELLDSRVLDAAVAVRLGAAARQYGAGVPAGHVPVECVHYPRGAA